MSVTAPQGQAEQAAFELRATTFTLPTLRLFDADLGELSRFLETEFQQAPEFFRNAPVVVDLSHLSEVALDFPLLVGLLRGLGLLPIGVRGGSAHIHDKQGEMRISSRTANVSPGGEKVVFSGEVNFLRPSNGGRSELSLRTSQLDVLTQGSQGMTNEPVTIQQPGLQITANGLHLYANTRVLKLKGRVKARYQNANRA